MDEPATLPTKPSVKAYRTLMSVAVSVIGAGSIGIWNAAIQIRDDVLRQGQKIEELQRTVEQKIGGLRDQMTWESQARSNADTDQREQIKSIWSWISKLIDRDGRDGKDGKR